MKVKEFYTHFAVAYGSCFLVIHVIAAITQSHIATGAWGFYGFPLVGLVYGVSRAVLHQNEMDDLRQKIDQIELQQLDQKYKLSDIEKNVHNQSRAGAE